MRRVLSICVILVLTFPLTSAASVLCTADSVSEMMLYGLLVTHPELPPSGAAFAYVYTADVDCERPTMVYCVDATVPLCLGWEYEQGPDLEVGELLWIVNSYFPDVQEMPSELATFEERAAAVAMALWHFSDGLDISEPGSGLPLNVFDAARAIIALGDGQTATVPQTPTSIGFATDWNPPVTVTATLYDQNGLPIPNVFISWEVTSGSSGSSPTNGDGQIVVSWFWVAEDVLTLDVDYAIPVGLTWSLPGCQDLIQAVPANGHLTAIWDDEPASSTAPSSWGKLKSLYR